MSAQEYSGFLLRKGSSKTVSFLLKVSEEGVQPHKTVEGSHV